MKRGLIGKDLRGNFTQRVSNAFGLFDYEMVEMNEAQVIQFVKEKNFEGINITFPYKKMIYDYVDIPSANAQKIHAIDTIVVKDGKTYGYNTDYDSFYYLIKRHNIDFKDKKVLILGNGGSSAAVQVIAKEMQASEIHVVDIDESEGSISYIECFAKHLNSDIVINTSPVGMSPDISNAPIAMSLFSNCETVIDLIYNPILTTLGFNAQELGIKRVIGIEMEVAQTKYAVELITGKKISDDDIDTVIHDLLIEKCNIVLIGMPSAGKTSIGQLLSKRLNKPFIDLDDVVVEKAQMSIPEIFAQSGEAGFRKLESMVALELSTLNNVIIATGGGTIKNKANMDALRLNGIVFFIDRDLDKLISSDPNRPLSSSKEALRTMHKERYPLYQKYSNVVVLNNEEMDKTVEEIIKGFHKTAEQAVKKDWRNQNDHHSEKRS